MYLFGFLLVGVLVSFEGWACAAGVTLLPYRHLHPLQIGRQGGCFDNLERKMHGHHALLCHTAQRVGAGCACSSSTPEIGLK